MKEDKQLLSTNWQEIEKRVAKNKDAIDYMDKHPLTHDEAVEQVQRLKDKIMKI